MAKNDSLEVFVSYSHNDELLRNGLQKHLVSLEREGLLATWYDFKIAPGAEWKSEIFEHLNKAKIILLLISSDFISSPFCYDKEMKRAIKRHRTREAIVIPVILRPVDWSGTPFAKLQALPKNAKPVTKWTNKDESFLDIVNGIRRAIKEFYPASTAQTKSQKATNKSIEDGTLGKSEGQWALVISATIRDLDKDIVEAIVEHLRKLSKDTHLTLKRIDPGSVRLVLEGSIEGLSRIKDLLEKQQLQTIGGYSVEKVDIEDLVTLVLYLEGRRPSEITRSDIENVLRILEKSNADKSLQKGSIIRRARTLCYVLLQEEEKSKAPGIRYFEQIRELIVHLQNLYE